MSITHELYMDRCVELAYLGIGSVSPNPMVGAILVYDGRIIGEGFHEKIGQPHAEVNCIKSVSEADKKLIDLASLYVSLEPCSHFGKTPPCCDLIIESGIKKVIIGTKDPYSEVNGKGIRQLQSAGIEVLTGMENEKCIELNKRFFTFHTRHRPYIILKWAQSANEKISANAPERIFISNATTNRLVHKWRSEEASILVGTNTALLDNPSLNNRLWHGKSPVRLVIDLNLRVPKTHNIFDHLHPTILFSRISQANEINVMYSQIKKDAEIIQEILKVCYERKMQSILVEGGAQLIQSFIHADLWDEARIITNEHLMIDQGLHAPILQKHQLVAVENITDNTIKYYRNTMNYLSTLDIHHS